MFNRFRIDDFYGVIEKIKEKQDSSEKNLSGGLLGSLIFIMINILLAIGIFGYQIPLGLIFLFGVSLCLLTLICTPYYRKNKTEKQFLLLCYRSGAYGYLICITHFVVMMFLFMVIKNQTENINIISKKQIAMHMNELVGLIGIEILVAFFLFFLAVHLGYYRKGEYNKHKEKMLRIKMILLLIFLGAIFFIFSVVTTFSWIDYLIGIVLSSVGMIELMRTPQVYMNYYLRNKFKEINWSFIDNDINMEKDDEECLMPIWIVKDQMIVLYRSKWQRRLFLFLCVLGVIGFTYILGNFFVYLFQWGLKLEITFWDWLIKYNEEIQFLCCFITFIFVWVLSGKIYESYYLKKVSVQETMGYFIIRTDERVYEIKKSAITRVSYDYIVNRRGANDRLITIQLSTGEEPFYLKNITEDAGKELDELYLRLENYQRR